MSGLDADTKKEHNSSSTKRKSSSSVQDSLVDTSKSSFGTRTLNKDDDVFAFNAWDNVEPDEEYKVYANERIAFQKEHPVPPEQAELYNSTPEKYWDIFYGKNQNRFFKDRNWFYLEFPELFTWTDQFDEEFILKQPELASLANKEPLDSTLPAQSSDVNINTLPAQTNENTCSVINPQEKHFIMELGCGAGNSVFPLLRAIKDQRLFVYACDFSKTAVDVLKGVELYEQDKRCSAFVWDITQTSLPENVTEGSIDTILCVFVLSAIHPSKMPTVVNNLYKLLKPGGTLLFRDYGKHDLAQVRLKKNRLLEDDFYIRGDGTRVFFFENSTIVSLFSQKFHILQNGSDKRLITNRHRQIKMHRVWIQAKLIKKSL
ncbi:hypothetical protein BB561_002317 [Smittium simulii]|uniref:tRNA N(3)-methylcytidine methyltransferase n=1 Tax=Smittium simulii TaxID=133385 RepID=A0A2T9YR35_9FUNG|nr:hypothetical protein BB561_002317 [Smittium simulii]